MRISNISIENFRNFSNIEVNTGRNLLLVGSNASGKSNFIHALRLVLDSNLSRKERKLTADDFWRGNGLLPWRGRQIKISVELTDFENNKNLRSYLDDCNPGKTGFAKITYILRPKDNVDPSQAKESDYEMRRYGGNDVDNEVPLQLFDYLNLRVINALRNAESELVARRVPLKSLLEFYSIDGDALKGVATYLEATNKYIESISAIEALESDIKERVDNLKEQVHELDPVLRLGVITPEDVLSALRILLEKDLLLPLHTTSLGLANLLYLALSLLEIEKRESIVKPVSENEYEFIILAIEEPEAHIHPHVQRLLFRDFLKRSPFILSTHSPHIASVAPLDSILMLRKPNTATGCEIYSTAKLCSELETSEIEDLQRYLDVTRAELLFARGIIFIEGDAEEFVIPVFAKLIGIELDKYGISVCNVRSTNFKPLVKLAGRNGLNIPFVVITDGDKYANLTKIAIPNAQREGTITENEAKLLKEQPPIKIRECLEAQKFSYYFGLNRCISLLDALQIDPLLKTTIKNDYSSCNWVGVIRNLQSAGIFVNSWSFEPSLFQVGYADDVLQVLEECDVGQRVIDKLRQQLPTLQANDENIEYWNSQIEGVGKGRMGQRLATKLLDTHMPGGREIPLYIEQGIKYLIKTLTFSSS